MKFASVALSPLSYSQEAKKFVERSGLPFLQGHRAASGAIRSLVDLQGAKGRLTPDLPAHENRAKALRILKGLEGPVDEATGAAVFELYGVRRPKEATVDAPKAAAKAARQIEVPRGGESPCTGASSQSSTRRGAAEPHDTGRRGGGSG